MIMLAFSVFDSKAELFTKPFYEATRGSAIRAFSDAVNKEDSDFNRHAEDYTLFHVGDFDDQTGCFVAYDTPHSLGLAITFMIDRFKEVAMAGAVPGLVSADQLED